MADQHKWFKFWVTAPYDDALLRLPIADRWAWTVLGAYTKAHGHRGVVSLSSSNLPLAAAMGVDATELRTVVSRLPHISVSFEEGKNRHDEFTVTWANWVKYQVDSTQAERAKSSRSKRRGEERRQEEKRFPSVSPRGGETHSEPLGTSTNGLGPGESETETAEGVGGADAEQLDVVPDEWRDAMTLLEFLNAKTGRTYGATRVNLALIDARLREGWSVQQCRTMVMRKWRDWRDDARMATYARPATLFNRTKLEGYMGELGFKASS